MLCCCASVVRPFSLFERVRLRCRSRMLVPTQLAWVAREPLGSTCALPPIPWCTSRLLKPGSTVRDEGLVFFVKFAYVEFRETRPPRAESCRRRLGRRNLNSALFRALVFLPIRLQAVGNEIRPCRQRAASSEHSLLRTRSLEKNCIFNLHTDVS